MSKQARAKKAVVQKITRPLNTTEMIAPSAIISRDREVITVDQLLARSSVLSVKDEIDHMRVKAAVIIAGAAVFIGVVFLGIATAFNDEELKAWATSLISLVVGAAIGFIFSGSNSARE